MEVGIVLLCFGGALLVTGIAFLFPYRTLKKLSAVTIGKVNDMTYDAYEYNKKSEIIKSSSEGKIRISVGVGNHDNFAGDSKKMYHMIYSYHVNGVEYSRADGLGYNEGIVKKKIGTTVNVYYDPSNPLKASLSNGKGYKILSCSLILLGLLLLIFGVFVL